MILLDLHEDLERAVGRLPRRIAYPLIFAYAVAIWSAIGIAVGSILRPYLQ